MGDNTQDIVLGLTLLNQLLTASRELGERIMVSRQTGERLDLEAFRKQFRSALAELDVDIARAEAEGR